MRLSCSDETTGYNVLCRFFNLWRRPKKIVAAECVLNEAAGLQPSVRIFSLRASLTVGDLAGVLIFLIGEQWQHSGR